ncbi:hypothetical protein OIU79_029311 [Salix purpurea]|uniref:Uncharacterized protein n=1 Tax=Salix purpurea TaxID=77065 RepID=A0A9Q0VGB3_SALPP|nr:hypothetical protein OIU79_029311 [Salix purpurea]
MKTIQWIKVKFRKLLDNKVDEGPRQVLEIERLASHGKKEEDDGKDKEIERLEGELGIKNSLTDQQSVGEKVIKLFEHRIEAKDEKIRQLEDELAMKAEENQRLKSQQDQSYEHYTC